MKFVEYLSLKDSAREFSSHLALISAFKTERNERANELLDKQLKQDIVKMGWRGTAVSGKWKGDTEKSYLVNAQALTEDSFTATILAWLNKYEQEAALVRYANSDVAWLLTSSGNRYKKGSWEEFVK